MVTYKIINKESGTLTFEYSPNGNGRAGTIAYNIKTGERIPLTWSPDDESHGYGIALWNAIEENLEDGIPIKDECALMWY